MSQELTEQQQKCMECQECCAYVQYPVTMLSAEVVDYYLMRGDKFYVQDNGAMMFYVKSPCQHLGPDGCTIYETRPPTCVNYMCPQGDKSVKDAFAHQIAVTLERVKIANKAWRDEQAKLKQVQEVKEAI